MVDYTKWDEINCEDTALESNLQRTRQLRARASELLSHGQYQQACDLYQQALLCARSASAASADKWDGIFKRGDTGSASHECRELQHSCLLNLATGRSKLGQYADAISHCDEAAVLDPSFPRTFRIRGEARLGCGDLKGAMEDMERAFYLDPDDVDVAARLAQVRERTRASETKENPEPSGAGSSGDLQHATEESNQELEAELKAVQEQIVQTRSDIQRVRMTKAILQKRDNASARKNSMSISIVILLIVVVMYQYDFKSMSVRDLWRR